MADETPETREEREARWWRDWWAADYSWDGLAKKEILGGGQWGEKTLQDYWRRDPTTGQQRADTVLEEAGELIKFAGRWWHLIHLPPRTENGLQTSWKGDVNSKHWARLSETLAARLALAEETFGQFGFSRSAGRVLYEPFGADRRVRLDGAMVQRLPPSTTSHANPTQFHLVCDSAAFLAELHAEGLAFGLGTSFYSVAFFAETHFDSATFSNDAYFSRATFFNDACFDGATFLGEVSLDGVVFCRGVQFNLATFSGDTSFYSANFSGEATFDNATFSKNAAFYSTTFLRAASFFSATFLGSASLGSCTFSERASFYSATFAGEADFYSAAFSGDVDYDSATFSGGVDFDNATISGYAAFSNTIFSGDARFDRATFSGGASFDRSRFAKAATFLGLFEDGGSFRNALFERQVTFSARVDRPEQRFAGAFYGARFADIADFSKSGPLRSGTTDRNDGARMAIAFAEALFEKNLILTDGSDAEAARAFRGETMKAVRDTPEGQKREDLLDRLEAGCRTVKIAMGKARDEVREQRYYRFQLQARHARRYTDWTEKAFGRLYGAASDYGGSLGRPLGCLIGLTVAFGFAYWLWAGIMSGALAADVAAVSGTFLSGESWANPAAAMTFSTGRSLFISAWLGVPEKDPTTWQWIFLNGYGPGWGFLVRLVAALQSIASGVLIFLFALAVRRKFQIGG